jgi:phospholipid transport system substrate-binding protein
MFVLVITLVVLVLAAPAHAATPTETIQGRVEEVQKLSRMPRDSAQGMEQRRTEMRRIADGLFDFTEMARRALGKHWADRTAAERQEFVRLFSDLMTRAYLGKLDSYAGEAINYVGEKVTGDQAVVQSRVITVKKSEVPIEYRLHKVGDRWAVYDVFIENVSLLSTYRSQFDRIIQTASFGDLLKRMRQKEQESASSGATTSTNR